jgi:hypothetical protein
MAEEVVEEVVAIAQLPAGAAVAGSVIPHERPGLQMERTTPAEIVAAVLPVVSVVTYGADPTGVVDSAAAINAAIAALPTDGGQVYFPPGDYRVTTTILIGNGSVSAESTRHGVRLIGAAAAGHAMGWGSVSGVRLMWYGSAGGTVIKVQGPATGCGIEGIQVHCKPSTNAAGVGVHLFHAALARLSDVIVYAYNTAGILVDAVGSAGLPAFVFIGGDDIVFDLVKCVGPNSTAADGLILGPSTEGGVGTDVARVHLRCSSFEGGSATGAGVVLRGCDNIVFDQCVLAGAAAIEVSPPSVGSALPTAITYINCATMGPITHAGNAWGTTHGITFLPLSTTDGGTRPAQSIGPLRGIDTEGIVFGKLRGMGGLQVSTIADGTIVTNTVTETTVFTWSVPAYFLSLVGTEIQAEASGFHSTGASTPNITFRWKLGGTVVAEAVVATIASAVTRGWVARARAVVRVAGSGGVMVQAGGEFDTGGARLGSAAGGGGWSIDLTVAQNLTLTMQWSAADAGHTARPRAVQVRVEYPVATS